MNRTHRAERWLYVALALTLLAGPSASCELEQPEAGADIGSIAVELSSVPPDVHCIRIDVRAPARSLSQEFSVAPGREAVLMLSGLPLGELTFSGAAFAATCDAVNATDPGDWSSDSVMVELLAGQTARVSLVMKRNGRASVEVSFEDDTSCASGEQLCSGVCVNTSNNPAHCGACNLVCPSGTTCSAGACVCPNGLVSCAGRCVAIDNDDQHCGACGNACRAGLACSGGRCVCLSGVDCGGVCVEIDFDRNNCGGCGRVCPASRPNCDGGSCFLIVP